MAASRAAGAARESAQGQVTTSTDTPTQSARPGSIHRQTSQPSIDPIAPADISIAEGKARVVLHINAPGVLQGTRLMLKAVVLEPTANAGAFAEVFPDASAPLAYLNAVTFAFADAAPRRVNFV